MTEEGLKSFLKSWNIEYGKVVPMSFKSLQTLLNELHCSSEEIFKLQNLGIIDITGLGEYYLTQKGINIRNKISSTSGEVIRSKPTIENWADFRKLIAYYLECIQHEDRVQFYIKPDKLGIDFYVPENLEYGWLEDLSDKEYKSHILKFDRKTVGMLPHFIGEDMDSQIYLGYPILATFDIDLHAKTYIPVATIPVKVRYKQRIDIAIKNQEIEVYFDFDEAQLNQDWIEKNVPDDAIQNLNSALEELYKTEGHKGKLALKQALQIILPYSKGYQEELFNPNSLDQILPCLNGKGRYGKLCNTAIIFRGVNPHYTHNLINELEYLLRCSYEELDNSALAYIYRNPRLKNENEKVTVPIPFIISNAEQLQAVEMAMQNHVCKIAGPPGTGKSQVAVNLISNLIFGRQSVLFTSRNKAALEAIVERSEKMLKEENISLVKFCVQKEVNINWYDLKYQEIVNTILSKENYDSEEKSKEFANANNAMLALVNLEIEKEEIRKQLESIEEAFKEVLRDLKNALLENGVKDMEKTKQIKEVEESLALIEKLSQKTFIGKIRRALANKKNFKRAQQVISSFSDTFNIYLKASQYSNIRNGVDKIINLNTKLDQLNEELETISMKDIAYDDRSYLDSFRRMEVNAQAALFQSIVEGVKNLNDEDLIEIKNCIGVFKKDKKTLYKGGLNDKKKYLDSLKKLQEIQLGWSSSLLSLYHASPMVSGIFDYVIIDEAAQCDPVSIIPALFRAKNAVIIGDDKQFKPIMTLSSYKNSVYWYSKVNDNSLVCYDYLQNSAYSIFEGFPEVMLKEHFRCAEEIAQYFNDAFYEGKLRVRTEDNGKLPIPKVLKNNNSFQWHDITDGVNAEIDDAVDTYFKIKNSDFEGSIGIISPLRKVVNGVTEKIYSMGYDVDENIIGTSYSFQGGQKDVIIFILGLADDTKKGEKWYLTNSDNKNIYNVAVSRAKACLIVIGNKELCSKADMAELRMLTEYPKNKAQRHGFDSVCEKVLYEALVDKGIVTKPQFPCCGYFLDLAYEDEFIKLDIEVDGRRYHENLDGTRVRTDILRDNVMIKHKWKPLRFWASEVMNHTAECVNRVELEIAHAREKARLNNI